MLSKKRFLLIAFFVALVVALNSLETQPPAGNDGAPNTIPPYQTCGQCHSGAPAQNAVPNVDFAFSDGTDTIPAANFQYELNKQYVVFFTPLTHSRRYGFQMSALQAGYQNGGTFAVINPVNTAIISTPTTYISHNNATNFHNWVFNWTAPSSDAGDITFYYAFNASDSSNTQYGDTIYVGSTVVHASPTGIQHIKEIYNLSVYPNPVADALNVSFDLPHQSDVEINLFSLEGKLMKTLYAGNNSSSFSKTFNLSDCTAGIYLLQLKTGDNNLTRKIVVQ